VSFSFSKYSEKIKHEMMGYIQNLIYLELYLYIYFCLQGIMKNATKFQGLTAEQLEKAANFLKAIAHPMRIAILQYLEGGKQVNVTEIHEYLKIEQSTTSHHLGILKDKGVLGSKREGKNTYYFIKNNNLGNILECVNKCAC
jgi:DNA-binding transcriptional ArsR family regulator